MKLKDYLEISQGCYCLILNNIGFKSRVFEEGGFNEKSKILNCNISSFYSTKIEDKIVRLYQLNELSVKEIAKKCQVSETTVYNVARRNNLNRRNSVKKPTIHN